MVEDVELEARAALERNDFEATLNALMEGYGDAVFRLCLMLLRQQDLAEDVRQLTFVQAFEALPRFRRQSTFRTWLLSIARNRCLDAAKHRKRQQRWVVDSDPPEPVQKSTLPGQRVERIGIRKALGYCLAKLSDADREAVVLRVSVELSYPEISGMLAVDPDAVRMRVLRALEKLRRCLSAKGVTP
ncbi:hypothetical protein ABI59_09305 [Acidobacteria bacterium Mor1]|nr:hypothetical protein ABI59_09305 [Acidobacteria bacterium Mor1]